MRNARRNRLAVLAALLAVGLLYYAPSVARRADGATKLRTPEGAPLLYAAQQQQYEVLAYLENARHGLPVEKIVNGVELSNGVATDASGHLYVANANDTVAVYRRGDLSPSKTYYAGLTSPGCIAVGGDGTLYVCNTVPVGSQPSGVLVYPPRRMKPARTLTDPSLEYVYGVAVDAVNNVYVSGFGSSPGIDVFPAGSLVPKRLTLAVNSPRGIAVAADGALVVADQTSNVGEIKVFPPGAKTASRIFGKTGYPVQICFSSGGGVLFVADQGTNVVEGYRYPDGRLVKIFASGMQTPYGVAVDPPAPPGPPFDR